MSARRIARRLACVAIAASLAVPSCTDLGDSDALSPFADAAASGDATVLDATVDVESEQGQSGDGAPSDARPGDASVDGSTIADSSIFDAAQSDSASIDAASPDAGAPDSALPDASPADAAAPDASSPDASVADASLPDGSSVDASLPDASLPDAAGKDSGSVGPCTSPGDPGCVACTGNTNGVCTPTEALFVAHDIAAGHATTLDCYACLVANGCIDDTQFSDKGHECGDLTGVFDAGGGAGQPEPSLCLATLTCILQTSCASSASGVASCYCGPAAVGSACASAGSSVDGACLKPEVDGLGLAADDNTDVLKNYTDTTRPSGLANQMIACASSNGCSACLR